MRTVLDTLSTRSARPLGATLTSALAGLVAVAATVVAAGPPASAEVVRVDDRTGDGSSGTGEGEEKPFGDIGKVRIRHGEERVKLTVRPGPGGTAPDYVDFWVDTRKRLDGPEFVATVSMEVLPRAFVARTSGFRDLDGEEMCEVRSADLDRRAQVVRVSFPRSCFGEPGRLRVSTQSSMEYGNADWAPYRRGWSRWASHG